MTKKMTTAKWYKLDVAKHLAQIMSLSNEEAGAFYRNLLMALATGVVGMCELADEMLEDSERISETRRKSARVRWGEKDVADDANAMQMQSKCNANPVCLSVGGYTKNNTKRESYSARARTIAETVPTVQEVLDRAAVIGMLPEDAQEFFEYWENSEWLDRNGVPVRNWKGVMAARLADLRNKPTPPSRRKKSGEKKYAEYSGHSEVEIV